MRALDLDIPVVVGGIVPNADRDALTQAGIAEILTPGASAEEIIATIERVSGP